MCRFRRTVYGADLAYAGRADVEIGLRLWISAAGELLVREAWHRRHFTAVITMLTGNIVAGNPRC